MKRIFFFAIIAVGLASCADESGDAVNPEMEALKMRNLELIREGEAKDSTLNEYFGAMNEIEMNLSTIKEKEQVLTGKGKDPELQLSQQEQIVQDIQLIQDLMLKNKEKLNSLNASLKKSKLNIAELNKRIDMLVEQLQHKDAEIAKLQQELFRVNDQLENLFKEYNNRIQDLADKDTEINTAWYAYGTYKELKENGVLTKEGGFIGLGRMEKLVSDFNRDYFRKVDVRDLPEIPLYVKTAKLITNHPEGTYKWEGDGKVDKLVITDVQKFWSSSKYLVILVE
ncbi:MAG: hypothetical protein H6585_04015 [Flavobacteriales bacterium]|nr:hypothetical protein [Flavobacteriales bacterium]MCB9447490.1 hypothetical protein [Flavobacteriales bacterium]